MRVLLWGQSRSGTTVTAQLLRDADVWVQHETRLYCSPLRYSMPSVYFDKLLGRCKNRAKQGHMPINWAAHGFIDRCNKRVKNKRDKTEWILAAEHELFSGVPIYGDKTGYDEEITFKRILSVMPKPSKVIYIHRDGRDVVSSGVRYARKKGVYRKTWAMDDPTKLSDHWTNAMEQWYEVRDTIPKKDRCVIRMEDLVHMPDKVAADLNQLTGIPEQQFLASILKNVSVEGSNIGYHQHWVPDWEDQFTDRAIKMLERLKYIGE